MLTSEILGVTYEAGSDGAAWQQVVTLLAQEFKTPIAGLDLEASTPDFNRDSAASINFDTNLLQTYLDEFRTPDVNVGMRMLINAPIGRAFNMWSYMDKETYDNEASTVAILKPQKIDKALMVTLDRSPGGFGFFSLYRQVGDDVFTDEQQKQLTFFAGHIQRSWRFSQDQNRSKRSRELDLDNLRRSGTVRGLMTIGKDYRIADVDAGGQFILSQKLGIVERQGRVHSLSKSPPNTTADLWSFIGSGHAAAMPFSISDQETYATTVRLYPGHVRKDFAKSDHYTRLEVVSTLLSPTGGLDRLAVTFSFTKAEYSVVEALSVERNGTEAAKVLGIARETMKTHLTSIYSKTGMRSMNELMLLVGRFLSPRD
ncbi:MAG: helix-turn-helix transcriptional regulator [Cohaesibacteraceae bacterium]